MTLAALINVPRTAEEWGFWSANHRLEHDRIAQAIEARNPGVILFRYQLDPIPFSNITEYLVRHQQSHHDFDAALGTQSTDLQSVDFNNPKQIEAWVWLNYLEHQNAAQTLGI